MMQIQNAEVAREYDSSTHKESVLSEREISDATIADLSLVSPTLARHEQETITKLWSGDDLSARDRCIVTLAVLIAKYQTHELPLHIKFALDNGVDAAEISELITHLAFYAGWPNAMAAVSCARDIFVQRKIAIDFLPSATPQLMPLDEPVENARRETVEKQFGMVAPRLLKYTTGLLFQDLWLRPGLAPRDRSLVTISSLIALGQVAQISYHLNRAMSNGLTAEEASGALTHVAFYAGWPAAFSALPDFKEVFEKRNLL